MPSWPATARAVRSLSPVSSTGRRPRPRSRATAAAAPGRSRSATSTAARACPSQPASTAVRPSSSAVPHRLAQRGGHLDGQLGEQPRAAHGDGMVPDPAAHPGPGQGGELGDRRQAAEPGRGLRGRSPGRWGARSRPRPLRPAAAPPSPRRTGAVMTPVTVMAPVVRVPVLSSTTTRIRRADSSACALLIRTPSSAPRPTAATQRGRAWPGRARTGRRPPGRRRPRSTPRRRAARRPARSRGSPRPG